MPLNWSSWTDFAAMGGYGGYVWGSFGVVAAALVAEVVQLSVRRAALRRSVDQMSANDDGWSAADSPLHNRLQRDET